MPELTQKRRRIIADMSRAYKIHELIGLCRTRTPEEIDRHYVLELVEDPQDGTSFDCDVFDALDRIMALENPTPAAMHAILHELQQKYPLPS